MVPLGLCTEVFINMNRISVRVYTIWLDVRLERRGQEHKRCSGSPPLQSTEPTGLGERPADKRPEQAPRGPQSPQARAPSPQSLQHPLQLAHTMCFSVQPVSAVTSHVPMDGQDSATAPGLPGSKRCRHIHSNYHTMKYPALWRVMHSGTLEAGARLTGPERGDGHLNAGGHSEARLDGRGDSGTADGGAGWVWAPTHVGALLTPRLFLVEPRDVTKIKYWTSDVCKMSFWAAPPLCREWCNSLFFYIFLYFHWNSEIFKISRNWQEMVKKKNSYTRIHQTDLNKEIILPHLVHILFKGNKTLHCEVIFVTLGSHFPPSLPT